MLKDDLQEFNVSEADLSGSNLIEASAGTGKTFNLSRIFLRLLLEKQLKISEILVVTFTISAASELRERIYMLLTLSLEIFSGIESGNVTLADLQEQFKIDLQHAEILNRSLKKRKQCIHLLEDALRNFEDASVFTIHGFCSRLLNEHAFEAGLSYDFEVIRDSSRISENEIQFSWRRMSYHLSENVLKFAIEENHFYDQYKKTAEAYLNGGDLSIYNFNEIESFMPDRFDIYYDDLKNLQNKWTKSSSVVKEQISQSRLNQKKYKFNVLDELYEAMDLWAQSDGAGIPQISSFPLLCRKVIQSNLTANSTEPDHLFFDDCQKIYDLRLKLKMSFVSYFHNQLEDLKTEVRKKKSEKSILTYDDLIQKVHEALKDSSGKKAFQEVVSKKYPAALIDEFQDTDRLQWEIFSALFAELHGILFIIGDPKQSIYKFRGADIHSYTSAKHSAKRRYTLLKNFRSTKEVLSAIDSIYRNAEHHMYGDHVGPFLSEDIPYRSIEAGKVFTRKFYEQDKEDAAFEFVFYDKSIQNESSLEFTAARIADLLFCSDETKAGFRSETIEEKINPSDIAVLVNTNMQAYQMQQELRKLDINSVLQVDESVIHTNQADSLIKFLYALYSPENLTLLCTALSSDLFSWTAEDIDLFIQDYDERSALIYELKELSRHRFSEGFMYIFQRAINMPAFSPPDVRKNTSVTPSEIILSRKDGEREMTNFTHLAELLQKQDSRTVKDDIRWMEDEKSGKVRHSEADDRLIRIESDRDAVQIMTIHKSKGLEFPIVFFPTLWSQNLKSSDSKPAVLSLGQTKNNTFVAPGVLEILSADTGGLFSCGSLKNNLIEYYEKQELESFQEMLRLVYVAFTRTVHKAFVIWGAPERFNKNAAFYLIHGSDFFKKIEAGNKKISGDEKKKLRNEQIIAYFLNTFSCRSVQISKPQAVKIDFEKKRKHEFKIQIPDKKTVQFKKSYSLSSYTSLMKKQVIHAEDYDEEVTSLISDFWSPEEKIPLTADLEGTGDIFQFEKGAKAGICIHEIFEKICFQNSQEDINVVVDRILKRYDYDSEVWTEVLGTQVYQVLNTILPGPQQFSLSEILDSQKITEMPFVMPVRSGHILQNEIPS
ncbi:MAG: UvrD-helicase domain-containing protein, partial [Spirochaetia bacterium]|nr:UvrD-helicase domain-containing protein [Spirochaetia bacterium]